MKTALIFSHHVVQFVLTPESDEERSLLKCIEGKEATIVDGGEFYDCKGGYMRWAATGNYGASRASTILVLREVRK